MFWMYFFLIFERKLSAGVIKQRCSLRAQRDVLRENVENVFHKVLSLLDFKQNLSFGALKTAVCVPWETFERIVSSVKLRS